MTVPAAASARSGPPRRTAPAYPHAVFLLFWLLGSLLLAFIALPLIVLGLKPSAAELARAASSLEVRDAILLSVVAAFLTTAVAVMIGVPLAYVLARTSFAGKSLVAAIIDLPLAVPHTVAGIALLMVFGRHGIIGEPASAILGLKFWGTVAGIVAAMLFVSAPYTVNAARIGFEGVDPRLEKVARTLGMGPWRTLFHVTLPLSRRSIMTGVTLTYARAISEFAAVVFLVYYPMTAPVEIYELFLRFGLDDAAAAAVLLLILCLALFILLRYFAYGRRTRSGGGR
jgi:molybdate/tungstate transport system permease protein